MGGRIIRMPGDAHREAQELLPWYVTGQLDPADLAEVEGHLRRCAECRADVAYQQQLAREIPQLPIDIEHSWSRMRRRLERERSPRGLAGLLGGFVGWRLHPGRGGVGAAPWPAYALTALLAMGMTALALPVLSPARYHALSAPPAAVVPGNIVVIFRPDTPEKTMRGVLRANHARLVDGPTAADGYVLQAPAAARMQVLVQLRARPEIILAEAIDQPTAR